MKESKKNRKVIEGHVIAKNKNMYQYKIEKKYLAGISLKGTEVKSLLVNGADLRSAFIVAKGTSLFLINAHIAQWKNAALQNHDPRRSRQLLLHKLEIRQIRTAVSEKGLTAVPINIIRKHGKFKAEIAVVKRMKLHDKRERLKNKEIAKQKAKGYIDTGI